MTTTATVLPAPLATSGDAWTHVASRTNGAVSYSLQEVTFDGYGACGVLVAGELHDLCRRCGLGYGHYLHNGEHDLCYECYGDGYGRETTPEDLIRRVSARIARAERKARKAAAEQAARLAAVQAWKDAHADLWAELVTHLPEVIEDIEDFPYRPPATTFLAKLAQQVEIDLKPLSDRQTAAASRTLDEKRARQASQMTAGHLGAVGERLDAEVTIRSMRDFASDYGTKWLVTMTTAAGHVLKTWSTGSFPTEVDPGDTVTIRGTVKSHGDYRGLPETTLTRVKIV